MHGHQIIEQGFLCLIEKADRQGIAFVGLEGTNLPGLIGAHRRRQALEQFAAHARKPHLVEAERGQQPVAVEKADDVFGLGLRRVFGKAHEIGFATGIVDR